jgi:uncharacterized protein YggE
MKKLSILLSVILLVGCTHDKEFKTIILKSAGLVEITPDEANIVINASCVNMDIKQAKSCLINITSKLNDDLLSSGIQKENILTTNVNLSKDYVWRNNSDIFNGYRASTTTSIKVSDLKTLDELYSKLLSNDKLTINSLTYGCSKMDSINEIAYLKALDNANKLADKILSQLPEKNKEITQVSNFEIAKSEVNTELNYKRFEDANQEIDKSTITVNIGKMVAIQQLFVEYKIY